MQKDVDYRKLKITSGNQIMYDFSDYKTFEELFRDTNYRKMSINEAEREQDEFDGDCKLENLTNVGKNRPVKVSLQMHGQIVLVDTS